MGAGRPKGSNCYGEKTRPVRIPVSQIDRVLRFVRDVKISFLCMPVEYPQDFHHRQMIILRVYLI